MLILAMANIFLSISTKSMTHPVSFMAIIIGQTVLVCLISSMTAQTPWLALVLFLIFLGGVMVLFIYMSSLASNENFLWEQKDFIIIASTSLIITASFFALYQQPMVNLNNKAMIFLNIIYSLKFSPLMIGLIVYLLVTLLVVSSIIKKNKSPMRSLK